MDHASTFLAIPLYGGSKDSMEQLYVPQHVRSRLCAIVSRKNVHWQNVQRHMVADKTFTTNVCPVYSICVLLALQERFEEFSRRAAPDSMKTYTIHILALWRHWIQCRCHEFACNEPKTGSLLGKIYKIPKLYIYIYSCQLIIINPYVHTTLDFSIIAK